MKIKFRATVQRGLPRFSLASQYAAKLNARCGDVVHVERIDIGNGKFLRPGDIKLTSGLELYVKGNEGRQMPRGKNVSVTISK